MEKKRSMGKELRKLADPQRSYIKETSIHSLNVEGRIVISVRDKFV